jgi:hypothetical protein
MPSLSREAATRLRQRQRQAALARWDNEGGAGPGGRPQEGIAPGGEFGDGRAVGAPPKHADWVRLQSRVEALECLVRALLADGSDRQRELVGVLMPSVQTAPGKSPMTPMTMGIRAVAQWLRRIG